MKTIDVHYVVTIHDDKAFAKARAMAGEKGYDHSDAGPLETLRRSLLDEGFSGTFPESEFDSGMVTFSEIHAAKG